MDEIRALLGRLAELTDEELQNARQLVLDEFAKLDAEDPSTENTAGLVELAEAGEQIMGEQNTRAEAQAEAEAGREAARERIAAIAGESEEIEREAAVEEEPEAVVEGEPEDPEPEEPEAEEEEEEEKKAKVDEADQREPVAASGGKVGRLARRGKAKPSPEQREEGSQRRQSVVVASGHLRVRDQNKPIESREELAEAMAVTLRRMSKSGPPRGDVLVASAIYDYPEERQLGDSPEENTRKMELVERTLVDPSTGALTATGGICQPVNIDYAVPTWATADRPLRDGLPAFQATRGGIRFVKPPDVGALAGATSIWTAATDEAPGEATKAILRIECGSEEHVFVEAIPTRLQFGNMFGRFAPEQVAANTDLAIAAAARVAENNILNLIAEKCVKGITNETLLGATRDLITVIQQTAAAYRQIHRIPRSQTLTAILPEWLKELIKIDIAREIGHGEAGSRDQLAVTEQQVVDLIRAADVNPIFHLDGQPESVEGGVSQVFATPVKGAIKPFPTKMVWYFFAEGMMQFLDGGRLDLGVVRDSTLDATNDYECHDGATTILTRDRGWQLFRDLVETDLVATRNPVTGVVEYQQPTHHTVGPRKGHMHLFRTPNGGEMMVSPRHRMLVTEAGKERFVAARDIQPGIHRIVATEQAPHENWESSLIENYDDPVYCVTVPNESLLTRRPGCEPVWAGNTFVEPFEGIAFRGFTNGALQLVTSLCSSGGTAGTISTAGKCA